MRCATGSAGARNRGNMRGMPDDTDVTEPDQPAAPDGLTAAGGWCAPAIPAIQARRGGMTFHDLAGGWAPDLDDDDPEPRRRRLDRRQRMAFYAEAQQLLLVLLGLAVLVLLTGVIRFVY